MSFLLLPSLTHLAFATMVIGGGGITLAKSLQGQNTISNPVSPTVRKDSSQVSSPTTQSPVSNAGQETQLQERQEVSKQEIPVKSENCTVIDLLNDIPESLKVDTQKFVSISCTDNVLNPFPKNWKGLFPKSIFKTGEQLNEGQELDIKIEDTDTEELGTSVTPQNTEQEYWSKITISSSKFAESSLSAEWSYLKENESWAVIKLTDRTAEEKIYLLLNEEITPPKNCRIIDSLNHTPVSFNTTEGNYFSVSCDTSNVDAFPNLLKGLFPKDLFKGHSHLSPNKKFEMKIETDMGENESSEPSQQKGDPYKITFSGEYLSNSSISGTWDYDKEQGAVVKLPDNKQIYLLLGDT